MTETICVNAVLEALAEPKVLEALSRVLFLDRIADRAVLIGLTEPAKQPFSMRLSELETEIAAGRIHFVQLKPPAYMLRTETTDEARASRDKNWERIAPLVSENAIFAPGAMGRLVSARAKELNVPRKTLYRILYRFWMNGQVRDALLPNYEQSGAPGKAKQFAEGKRAGRTPQYQGLPAEQPRASLSEADKECIRIGYALYKQNAVKSLPDAYIKTIRRFYATERKVAGVSDDDIELRPLHELPTLRQFTYWGQKAFSDLDVLRGRKGERNWQKDHRALSGRVSDGVRGPCHRFEIDATIADIYLVSRYNRSWIIGRPVVYVVVDVFSAMIVGVFVGLEGPSWNGARQALFNTCTDKVSYCAAHGITINQNDWPCHHLPQEIMCDRGEMIGKDAEAAMVSGLGTTLAIAPPYRPDWKSIVESRFRLLNQTTQIHWTPGAVRQRNLERGERDYRLDATLDLSEFTHIILSGVLHYNHHHRRPDRLTAEMIASGMTEATPLALWNWGMTNGQAEPRTAPMESIYRHLATPGQGSVRESGIYFKGMYYVCEQAETEHWFAKARKKGYFAVDLWYDLTSTERVWIRGRDGRFEQCRLRKSEVRYLNRRFEEVEDMLSIVETPSPEVEHATLSSRVRLDAAIESKINHASAEKKATVQPETKSERLGKIRDNRAREREGLPRSPVTPADPAGAPTTSRSATDYAGERSGEVIDLLAHLRPEQTGT